MVNVRRNGKLANVEEYRRRKVDPDHDKEETVVSSRPSGVKRKAAHAANASSLSDSSGDSHQRARQLGIASSTSTRVVTVTTAAEVVTMPGIRWQHSSAKGDSSVKTEVQLFF